MAINKESRSELSLEWLVKYKDGETLSQYDDKENKEYHFGHIDQERLKEFILISKVNPNESISVSFETGLFHLNGSPLRSLEIDNKEISLGTPFENKKVTDKKLIYFRRVRRDFGPGGQRRVRIAYFIGYEANVDGKRVKELLQVNPDGTITVYEDPAKKEGFTRI